MNLNDMFPSKWLSKEDVKIPVVAVIRAVQREEIGGMGNKESKPTLQFQGDVKPMILNRGNADMIASIYGSDTNAWIGKVIEIYCDPNVMYAGKRTGGVRVRRPSQPAGPLWDISDGKTKQSKMTTEQVHTFLKDLHESVPLNTIRIRQSGSQAAPESGDVWMLRIPADKPQEDDQIPF